MFQETYSVSLKLLFLILLFPAGLLAQDAELEKKVMRSHDNGKPHVILYFNKENNDLVKEEVFYSSGKMEWTGTYKNNKENGIWQFYHKNGSVKTVENYQNGKEHGVCTHYDDKGKKVKESYWKNGRMVKEVNF